MSGPLLIVAAFIVRYATVLGQGTAWFDESFSLHFASKPLPEMLSALSHDVHPPLHAALLNVWMKLVGTGIFEARMLSVVLGVLAVPVMMRLASRYGKEAAFVSGSVTALSPILLFHSADARMYPLLLVLVALATQAFLDLLDGKAKALIRWSLWSGLALLTHVTAALPFLIMCVYGWCVYGNRKRLMAAAVLAALPAAGWIGAFTLGRIGLGGGEWQLAMPSRGGTAIARFLDLFAYSSSPWLRGMLLVTLLAVLGAAVLKVRKADAVSVRVQDGTDRTSRFLLIAAFAPFLVFMPVHVETTKYLFVAYPALVTLVSLGVIRLLGRRHAWKAVAAFLLIIAVPLMALMTERRIRWDDAMAFIQAGESPGDIVYAGWFASELSIRQHYSGASEILSAYSYDPSLDFEERLVRHAGQIRITDEVVDRMAEEVSTAPHVFLVTGQVDISLQPIPRWYFEHGWRLVDRYESNEFSPIVLKLANPVE